MRMAERSVTKADVRNLGSHGIIRPAGGGKFKVTGLDLDGVELAVVCVYEGGTLIITVF
ncbi:MAG: hypothetical protein C5B49_00940 [Bdellovibrio sp.]|nr:MAG: hypothetical protein C5B49_00940 [Bdellovibrio sp.]